MLYRYDDGNNWFEKIQAQGALCLTVCLLAGCLRPQAEFLPQNAATQTYSVEHLAQEPELDRMDGLKAFRSAVPMALREKDRVILYRDSWSGPQDLSGEIRLAHSDHALYLAAQVTDDDVQYAGHPGEWSGDAVNLFLKTETEEGTREFIFKFSCAGTRYCYYNRLSYNGEEYQWGASRAERVKGGYWIAAEIPKRNLGLLGMGDERVWFNVSIEDNNKGGYMMLLGQSEGFLNEPAWIAAELR
ncbi:hypothetical protein JXA32_06415 [Candidatus Sumerlaeota bacterium]|nr:hypothetical protein [Candidatus Sumerlaeota bacterium]